MSVPVMTWDQYATDWAGLHGGADLRVARPWVRRWLRTGFVVAGVARRAHIRPAAVTTVGLAASVSVPLSVARGAGGILLAAALVAVAILADTVDGALAVMTGHTTRLGYVYDAVVDRIGEACWLIALWRIGAAGHVVVAAGALAWLHEYVRSRGNAAGMTEITAVTVGERPTRVILTIGGLALAGIAYTFDPRVAAGIAALASAIWIVFGLIGLVQLLSAVHRALVGQQWPTRRPAGSAAPAGTSAPAGNMPLAGNAAPAAYAAPAGNGPSAASVGGTEPPQRPETVGAPNAAGRPANSPARASAAVPAGSVATGGRSGQVGSGDRPPSGWARPPAETASVDVHGRRLGESTEAAGGFGQSLFVRDLDRAFAAEPAHGPAVPPVGRGWGARRGRKRAKVTEPTGTRGPRADAITEAIESPEPAKVAVRRDWGLASMLGLDYPGDDAGGRGRRRRRGRSGPMGRAAVAPRGEVERHSDTAATVDEEAAATADDAAAVDEEAAAAVEAAGATDAAASVDEKAAAAVDEEAGAEVDEQTAAVVGEKAAAADEEAGAAADAAAAGADKEASTAADEGAAAAASKTGTATAVGTATATGIGDVRAESAANDAPATLSAEVSPPVDRGTVEPDAASPVELALGEPILDDLMGDAGGRLRDAVEQPGRSVTVYTSQSALEPPEPEAHAEPGDADDEGTGARSDNRSTP